MTRPTRNRLLMVVFWLAFLIFGNVVWPPARLPLVGLLLAAALVSFVVSRDFFVGRHAMRDKRWVDALLAFDRFETGVAQGWRRNLSWLAIGVYSFDPAAIARNNRGVVHLENGRLDLAQASFDDALRRDPFYAVPHLNLAVVAAKRGDARAMEAELAEAKRLGLPSRKTHAKVRAALKLMNETAGLGA